MAEVSYQLVQRVVHGESLESTYDNPAYIGADRPGYHAGFQVQAVSESESCVTREVLSHHNSRELGKAVLALWSDTPLPPGLSKSQISYANAQYQATLEAQVAAPPTQPTTSPDEAGSLQLN